MTKDEALSYAAHKLKAAVAQRLEEATSDEAWQRAGHLFEGERHAD